MARRSLGRAAMVLGLAAAAVTSGGCVYRTIAEQAVSYNLAVERAQEEILLLNAVRASQRLPMHFTAVGALRGNLKLTAGTGSIRVPFGADADDEYSATPSASYSTSPTFEVAVLDTQEFLRGILSPIKPKILYFYWQQGWPAEVLLHVLVERIERVAPSGSRATAVYDNDPEERDSFDRFQRQLRHLLEDKELAIVSRPAYIGPPLSGVGLAHLSQLISVGNSDQLRLEAQANGEFRLRSAEDEYGVVIGGTYQKAFEAPSPTDEEAKPDRAETAEPGYRFFLRSPHGILYYLGEIARAELRQEDPYTPMIRPTAGEEGEEPLFLIHKEGTCPARVKVDYDGETYRIPKSVAGAEDRCRPGRSMQVLSLVSQLLGLQKRAQDLPSTAVVQVVGQ